jgi:hypothetical protein
MKAWVGILSAAVVVQGGLLASSLRRIERLNEVLFVHSKKETIYIPELRVFELTARRLVLVNGEGKPVGELSSSGGASGGPSFSLTHRREGEESVLQGSVDNNVTYVLMKQTGGGDAATPFFTARSRFTMRDGKMGLHVEPAYYRQMSFNVGSGYVRNNGEGAPYWRWGYQLPGLPWFSYPRELSALRKELAALTLETDEGKQRELMHEIGLQHGLGRAFPEIARLCEAHPKERDFPRGFIQHARSVEECRALVLESLARKPSYTMVTLLAQMIAEGGDKAGEIDLRDYLSALARRSDLPPGVKRHAEGCVKSIRERHPRKAPAKPNPDPGN